MDLLIDAGAVRFGDFVLSSGLRSNYYIDLKAALSDPFLLREVSSHISRRLTVEDRIAGIELGGVPLAVAVSLYSDIPFLIVRKGAHPHGTRRPIEGSLEPGDRVLIVDDVVTTGESVLKGIEVLRSEGCTVNRIIAIVDRNEGGRESLKRAGVRYDALLNADDLIRRAKEVMN